MSIFAMIKSGFDAVSGVFGWVRARLALKNAAPVVQAKAAQQERDEQNQTANAIEKKDTNEIRNELAE